jgi:hypothetical protein
VEFCLVDPAKGREAFQWHSGYAAANNNIFPRSWDTYEALAAQGRIWCARSHSGNYVALSYFSLDQQTWEIGGLMVDIQERNKGVAAILVRLTLGHLLFVEDPLSQSQAIIAHVHEHNPEPRRLLDKLKFHFARRIAVPATQFPGLKANSSGQVVGDQFQLTVPDALDALADWCDAQNASGVLPDGRQAQITLSPGTSLDLWSKAFRDMARKSSPVQPSTGPHS